MIIKDWGKTNICCYAWYIPLLTKSPPTPDVVGAVTPVASEVISLLLVKILQVDMPTNKETKPNLTLFMKKVPVGSDWGSTASRETVNKNYFYQFINTQ